MTAAARKVLADCHIALQLLEEETQLLRWRIHWIAAITLIRAVGHVLDKIDGNNVALKIASQAAFKAWKQNDPSHQIFRDFIDRERNNVLKEYRFNLHPLEKVTVAAVAVAQDINSPEKEIKILSTYDLEENIYRPVLDGYRQGDDVRDIYADAIQWWNVELDLIDFHAGSKV